MRTTQSLSITLPLEMAKMVKNKVLSGEYATESEVIRDGLRTLTVRDAVIEKWLHSEVLPTLNAINTDPSLLIDADDAWKILDAHMSK